MPNEVEVQAEKAFVQWTDSIENGTFYDGLHWECVGKEIRIHAVRVGLKYRASCVKKGDEYAWFWIGTKEEWARTFG